MTPPPGLEKIASRYFSSKINDSIMEDEKPISSLVAIEESAKS